MFEIEIILMWGRSGDGGTNPKSLTAIHDDFRNSLTYFFRLSLISCRVLLGRRDIGFFYVNCTYMGTYIKMQVGRKWDSSSGGKFENPSKFEFTA